MRKDTDYRSGKKKKQAARAAGILWEIQSEREAGGICRLIPESPGNELVKYLKASDSRGGVQISRMVVRQHCEKQKER